MGDLGDAAGRLLVRVLDGRTSWDEPPALHFIYDAGADLTVGAPLIPDLAWNGSYPPAVLAALARETRRRARRRGMAARMRAMLPAGFCGALLRCETYHLSWTPGDVAAEDQARAAHQAGEIWRHPQRVESRCAWAYLTGGETAAAAQRRGGAARLLPDADEIEPTIGPSLKTLVQAFTGTRV